MRSRGCVPVQALVFLGLGALFQIPRLRAALVPKSVRDGRAARHAREQFFLQGLHRTELRTGTLVFVSLAEHYVEILADTGIADRVEDGVWDEAVAEFVRLAPRRAGRRRLRGSRSTPAGTVPRRALPRRARRRAAPTSLPNRLIEV